MINKCKVAFTTIKVRSSIIGDSLLHPKKGSHPDSLYRVAQLGGHEAGGVWGGRTARLRGSCRLLRWPLALAAVILALALLVYFLMPETTPPPVPSHDSNITEWILESKEQSGTLEDYRYPDAKTTKKEESRKHGNSLDPTVPTTTKRPETSAENNKDELNFGYADDDSTDDEGNESFVALVPSGVDPNVHSQHPPITPSPPIFPTNLSPSVQYGNEHQDAESNEKRTPKKQPYPVTDIYDNKFLTQTFAIFYNKDALESTTTGSNESVEKDDDKFNEEGPEISKPNIDKGVEAIQHIPAFTSGHQNSFGIPIEEAVKIQSTTQSAVYNTRVSPTLPSMVGRNKVRSTTVRSRWNTTEDGICFSTRLSMCRGVLPYDLTTQPLDDGARLLGAAPLLRLLLRSGCSSRARQFLCALLEPECRPTGMKVLPPCRQACEEIASSCRDVIAAGAHELATVFECSQYPSEAEECASTGARPVRRRACSAGELRCSRDGSCVPAHWRCDSISDCPDGTDEQGCEEPECGPNEFRCGETGGCIKDEWVCDGHVDCLGGADERDCAPLEEEGATDVQGAASQHPRPARLPRPLRLQTTTSKTTSSAYTVTPKPTMEYDSSKELLMMSDSVMPVIKSLSALTARKKPGNPITTTPRVVQVTSGSSSINIHRTSSCPIGDPNCKRRISNRILPCIRGNCVEDKKTTTTTTTEAYNITQKAAEMEAVSGLTSHSSPCPQGELRCVDGRCITLEQLCDHHTDCTDGADEANCFT